MTVSQQPDSPATPELIVRDYAEGDYRACRALWAELTEYHRGIYGNPSIGGDDPGAGFDGYLAAPQRIGSWVAESHGRVVGLTGLLDQGTSAEVEPVVVTGAARDQGIGRRLISRVVEEALARGYGGVLAEVPRTVHDCPDHEDNLTLDLAAEVGALILVSNDSDLLSMSPWRGTPIIGPTAFAAKVDAMRRHARRRR